MNTRYKFCAVLAVMLLATGLSQLARAQACVDYPRNIWLDRLEGINAPLTLFDFQFLSADGKSALSSLEDQTLQMRWFLWSPENGIVFLDTGPEALDETASLRAVSADLEYATVYRSSDRTTWRWRVSTGQFQMVTPPEDAHEIEVSAVSNDGTLFGHAFFGTDDSNNFNDIARAWYGTPTSGEVVGGDDTRFYRISQDGSVAIVTSRNGLLVWTEGSGELKQLEGAPEGSTVANSSSVSLSGGFIAGSVDYDSDDDGVIDRLVAYRWSAPDHFNILDYSPNPQIHSHVSAVLEDGTVIGREDTSRVVWPGGGTAYQPIRPWFAGRGFSIPYDVMGAFTADGRAFFRPGSYIARADGGCTPAIHLPRADNPTSFWRGSRDVLYIHTSGLTSVDVSLSVGGVAFQPLGVAVPGQPVTIPYFETEILYEPLDHEAVFILNVPAADAPNVTVRFSGGGRTKDYIFGLSGPVAVTPLISDVRLSGGTIRTDPFPGVSAGIYEGETLVELQLTDDAGAYTFSEVSDGQTYDLRLTDTDTWGIERAWTGLLAHEVYKQTSLPATLMKQLDALADSMALRHYHEDALRALITPYEQWAGPDFTQQATQVDTALARLIVAHQALQTMHGNTLPVAKELATGLAELLGFGLSYSQSWGSINSTVANRVLPTALARRFQRQTEGYAAAMLFNTLTNQIIAAMPPEFRPGLQEARAVIMAQMQAALAGSSVNALSLMQAAALRVGTAVGDDVLMKLFQVLTQEDLDRAVALATAFDYSGSTQASWQAVSTAGIDNFTESDDAASFSLLTRGTATGIGGVTGLAGGFIRLVALARILRVAQLAGYVAAIGRTGYQFYDTAANDLPHAVSLAFDPLASAPGTAPSLRAAEKTGRLLARSSSSAAVEDETGQYLQVVDELVALAQSGDREAFIEKLSELLDAADILAAAAARAQLPLWAVAEEAQEVDGYADANAALAEALVNSGTHHLAFSAYALGYLDGEATPSDLAAQADTTHDAFDAVVPAFEAVSALVADLPVPALIAVTEHSLSVDSVEAGESFTISATIRNGGGLAAEDVEVTLLASANLDIVTQTAINLGQMEMAEEQVVEWTLAVHDTATVGTFQIQIASSNAEVLPALGGFAVAGAFMVGTEDGVDGELPERVTLEQNYPNPFSAATTIRYALPEAGEVRLSVYDLLGREVAVLLDGAQPAGRHEANFDGSGLPSGVYVYRLQAGGQVLVRRMVFVK